MTNDIIQHIRKALRESSDEKTRETGQHFFKEKVWIYGVKTTEVNKIGKQYYQTIKDLPAADIFELCDELWKSGFIEESIIACIWTYSVRKEFEPKDFEIFEKWVNAYVNNWASCDTLCNHTIGAFLEMYPEYLTRLRDWTQSSNRWVRRASAVSLIVPARNGKFLEEVFAIADLLLTDKDDLVQKGFGWLLKSASKLHQKEVFDYVMRHKAHMPRTALRYAIKKMPPELRAEAMKKQA